MKKYLYSFFIFALCATCFTNCKDKETDNNFTGVTINKSTMYLSVDETEQLTAKFVPENTTKAITWSSTAPTIATVNDAGVVTGVKAGTAGIIVKTADGSVNVCNVTVRSISVNKDKTALVVGGTEVLSLNPIVDETFITTANGTTAKPATVVTWTSSDPTIALVANTVTSGVKQQTGTVTAKRTGVAKITFNVTTPKGTYTGTCEVTVGWSVITEVKINKTTTTLTLSSLPVTETLTATITPTNATYNTVTWSSSNEGIAIVNLLGVVTAVAEGSAIITATAKDGSGIKGECTVTVKPIPTAVAVTGVTINSATLLLSGNGTPPILTATIVPATATNKTVIWSSSDPDIVDFIPVPNTNGLSVTVVHKTSGTVTITVTTADGTFTKTCEVTVDYIKDIALNKTALALKVRGTVDEMSQQLFIVAAPIGTIFLGTTTWSSSNPKIATVNPLGVVTAVAVGTAKITATTTDNSVTPSVVKKFDCTVTVK